MISGEDLKDIGYPEGPAIGAALRASKRTKTLAGGQSLLKVFEAVRADPRAYESHPTMSEVARCFLKDEEEASKRISVRSNHVPFKIWGEHLIEGGALNQMYTAMKMEPTLAGALLPDAHQGYALPVGGVWALDNCVSPNAIGFDIGCRLHLSVLKVTPEDFSLMENKNFVKHAINAETRFNSGARFDNKHKREHEVMNDPLWNDSKFLRKSQLKTAASQQLGTSGGGNHFVEFGIFGPPKSEAEEFLGGLDGVTFATLSPEYIAILSHSGSRRLGHQIAEHFRKEAEKLCLKRGLPHEYKDYAWLSLDEDLGKDYWRHMELAGRYARANHELIHESLLRYLGISADQVLRTVDHHHNFCLPGNTIVPTVEGPVRMRDLKRGDLVYSMSDDGLDITKVKHHWCSGMKDVVTISTLNRKICVSKDHPILTINLSTSYHPIRKWHNKTVGKLICKQARDIKKGDIVVCAEGYYSNEYSFGEDLARVVGAWLGDGWIRHKGYERSGYNVGLAIGSENEEHTYQYCDLLESTLPSANWKIGAAGAFGITTSAVKVYRKIEELELNRRSLDKRVPKFAFKMPVKEKLSLLAGYVDADGYIANDNTSNHGATTAASTNKKLMDDLREIAISCGMRVGIVKSEIRQTNFGECKVFKFSISADSTYLLPLWHRSKCSNQRLTVCNRKQGLQLSSIGYLDLPAGLFAQKVRYVVDMESELVYDIEVDHESHSFIADGIVVHNCWKEVHNSQQMIVHRKGATPAAKGELGVIPGTMADPGYVVEGLGNKDSLSSASHGAGRVLSRRKAKENLDKEEWRKSLQEKGISVMGSALDEAPAAYKNIDEVMDAQHDLVEVVGRFDPRIVKMASDGIDL